MSKKSQAAEQELQELQARVERQEAALSVARKGLLRIEGINPLARIPSPGGTPSLVVGLDTAKLVAEKTLLDMSDKEHAA